MLLRQLECTTTLPFCTKHAIPHQYLFYKRLDQIHRQTDVYIPQPMLACPRRAVVDKVVASRVHVLEGLFVLLKIFSS